MAVIIAVVAALAARDRIAEALARDWLQRQGAPSALKIRALSLTGLTAGLSIGDPRSPDLSVERVDIGYVLTGPWNGEPFGVRTRSIRLVRPQLKARLAHDGHLDFGALAPLMKRLAAPPQGRGAGPDVAIDQGELQLSTPGGPIRIAAVDARLRSAVLEQLGGEIAAFDVVLGKERVKGGGGTLALKQQGDHVEATIDLGPLSFRGDGVAAEAARVELSGAAPAPKGGRFSGPARLSMTGLGVQAGAASAPLAGLTVNADLVGQLDADVRGQRFAGRLLLSAQSSSGRLGPGSVRGADGRVDLARFSLAHAADTLSLTGMGTASLDIDSFSVHGGALSLRAGAIELRQVSLRSSRGRVDSELALQGQMGGRAGLSAEAARRFVKAAPLLSGDANQAAALERALRAFRFGAPSVGVRWSGGVGRLDSTGPVTIEAASGARLSLASTHASLAAAGLDADVTAAALGGGLPTVRLAVKQLHARPTGFHADVDLDAQGDLGALFASGAHVRASGRLAGVGGRGGFTLGRCAFERVDRLALPSGPVTGVSGRLCPTGHPLIAWRSGRWDLDGRLEDLAGAAPAAGARFAKGDIAFAADGVKRLDEANLILAGAELLDNARPLRFHRLNLHGRMALDGDAWTGDFVAATGADQPVGRLTLRHDIASGTGRADIDTGRLTFEPNGLQPGQITPLADALRQANGPVTFRGWFQWAPRRATISGGELSAHGLRFKSPVGAVLGIDGDVHFASLTPLITQPDQALTIATVQAPTPVTALSVHFKLGERALVIGSATGAVAQGVIRLEPTVAPLADDGTVKGVLVLDHVRLGDFIAASNLSEAINLDAVVDGRIPFSINKSGISIHQGVLDATAPGRLSISRKALRGGQAVAAPGVAEDFAYQALEHLAFDTLHASIDSLPGDRLGIVFHVKGRHLPPVAQQARIGVLDLLQGKALAKPIPLPSGTEIDLTLDTSLNFGELVRALQQAWRESMGASGAGANEARAGSTKSRAETEPR